MDARDIRLPIPERYRRGAQKGEEGTSVQSGLDLLDWVARYRSLEGARILDFGCGVKLAQALYQRDNPQALYAGLDVYGEMIDHLTNALRDDPRYLFRTVPFRNAMYNAAGQEMLPESDLPLTDSFDILLMFSVITHMVPADSHAVMSILRRYAAANAKLLFWAFADEDQVEDFRDDTPGQPLLRAKYNRAYLESLIAAAGWSIDVAEHIGKKHRKIRYVCTLGGARAI